MRSTLDGSWSLVLGASSGMGAAAARAIAGAGGNVVGVHLDAGERRHAAAALAEELRGHGVDVEFFNANAASAGVRREVVGRLAELAADRGVRVVLHSVAFGSLVPFVGDAGAERLTQRQMDMTLDVMAHSLVYWVQDLCSAGLLRPGAKVLAMTSAGDQRVAPNYGAVSAAKCALESHVRQLALELAPAGVAVNALRAGVTLTPALQRIPGHELIVERVRSTHPHGRLTQPDDVAEAVVLLASSDSSWVTGNVIGVDGGEALTA
jgi:NAD(P)-dependent dehydrogenase (short-subunit alcohol dehydrogenase family)